MSKMNAIRSTSKYLQILNLKTVVNSIKSVKPKFLENVVRQTEVLQQNTLKFAPRTIGVEIGIKPNVNQIQKDPVVYTPIVNPRSILPLIESNWRKDEICLPTPEQEEKLAIRLLVIRHKKMKKHQRRKLWKRMRHRWAKVKQRRRQIKEKIFQNELLALVKSADEFSAEQYVADKIAKVNHTPLPTSWKGRRLPPFIIRQLMGIDKKINYKHTDVYKA